MSSPPLRDSWAAGDRYEPYVGRWSRVVAREFIAWLAVPPASDWLDVGCGTGALSQTILDLAAPRSVRGIDPSAGFVEYAKAHVRPVHASGPATFQVGDARAIPLDTASVDAAIAGLVLNFVPEPSRAVAEMARVVRPGGTVAAYVWDYDEGMQFMRYFWDTAVALDPGAAVLHEGRRFTICQPGPLGELFANAGLQSVETRDIVIPTIFRDWDDFWSPFFGGQGPSPTYVHSLDESHRVALADALRARLPIAPDGTISLTARAWSVRARKLTTNN